MGIFVASSRRSKFRRLPRNFAPGFEPGEVPTQANPKTLQGGEKYLNSLLMILLLLPSKGFCCSRWKFIISGSSKVECSEEGFICKYQTSQHFLFTFLNQL